MGHFFTSDLHLSHGNILKYSRRTKWMTEAEIELLEAHANFKVSYNSVKNHDDEIIANINKTVGKEDHLWLLGDFCFANHRFYFDTARNFLNRINCRHVHMIWGNHDLPSKIDNLFLINGYLLFVTFLNDECFISLDGINDKGQFKSLTNGAIKDRKPKGLDVVMSHTAFATWPSSHKGAVNLYGHSHANAEDGMDRLFPGRRSIDVGIDNSNKVLGEYRPFSLDEIKVIMNDRSGSSIDHH